MQTTTLRFGLYAGGSLILITLIQWITVGPVPNNWQTGEIIGYASMVLATSFIYFAIRRYRDELSDGALTFGKGVAVGLVTDLVGSTLYGIFMAVYFSAIAPEFLGAYADYYLEGLHNSGLPADEIARQVEAFEASKELLLNPWLQSVVMFATLFLVGVGVTVISAALLRKTRSRVFDVKGA